MNQIKMILIPASQHASPALRPQRFRKDVGEGGRRVERDCLPVENSGGAPAPRRAEEQIGGHGDDRNARQSFQAAAPGARDAEQKGQSQRPCQYQIQNEDRGQLRSVAGERPEEDHSE